MNSKFSKWIPHDDYRTSPEVKQICCLTYKLFLTFIQSHFIAIKLAEFIKSKQMSHNHKNMPLDHSILTIALWELLCLGIYLPACNCIQQPIRNNIIYILLILLPLNSHFWIQFWVLQGKRNIQANIEGLKTIKLYILWHIHRPCVNELNDFNIFSILQPLSKDSYTLKLIVIAPYWYGLWWHDDL